MGERKQLLGITFFPLLYGGILRNRRRRSFANTSKAANVDQQGGRGSVSRHVLQSCLVPFYPSSVVQGAGGTTSAQLLAALLSPFWAPFTPGLSNALLIALFHSSC